MDPAITPPSAFSQLWYMDEARSALARYIDNTVNDLSHVAPSTTKIADTSSTQRRRNSLLRVRNLLDDQGPFHVPAAVIAGAMGHWQARFDEADMQLRTTSDKSKTNRYQIQKFTSLIATNAIRELAIARGIDLGPLKSSRHSHSRKKRSLMSNIRNLLFPRPHQQT